MPLTCPVCRAPNDAGPTCRRCRADLSLVVAVEARRAHAIAAARAAAGAGRWDEARDHARRARELRRSADVEQLLAALALAAGDRAAAWTHYRAAQAH
jgi:hypothetical protein